MIARRDNLRKHRVVFERLTGLTIAAFDAVVRDVVPVVAAGHRQKLNRPDRQRAVGGGDPFDRPTADQLLLTVIWLRQYPTNEVLGFRFGVPDSTASRVRTRCVPALAKAGRDTMRKVPDAGAVAGRGRGTRGPG